MSFFQNRLFSFAPLGLLPLMDMSTSQIVPYIYGLEPDLRRFVAEFIIQQLTAIASSIIVSFTRLFLGGFGT